MYVPQKKILKLLLPFLIIIISVCTLIILTLIYKLYEHPLWIKENGIIETISAIAYFLAALLMILKGGWAYVKEYNYFFILVIMMGLRELDFDKKFTSMGIFKSKFYLSHDIAFSEKLIGLFVIIILLYSIISVITNHAKGFFTHIKNFSSIHIGILLIIVFAVFSKTIDGIARKLRDFNIILQEQTVLIFESIEEILELGIPLFIISIFLIYHSRNNTF